jgi:hypothetical protein
MSSIRIWHTYLGLLIAPSVLFFALTGALQLFNLHEAHGAYQPLPVIEKLGRLHKEQVFAQEEGDEQRPEPEAGTAGPEHPPGPEHPDETTAGQVLLKCFFLLVALGLATSTILGLWMGLTQIRRKNTGRILLAVGVVLPIILVFFGS